MFSAGKQRVPQLFEHCLCAFDVLLALSPCTPCPPAAHPCSSLCPAQLCSLWCAGSSTIPWGRSHLAEPWDPGDVSVNTCTLVSHTALGQPCHPRCRVPSAPSGDQAGPVWALPCCRVQVEWTRQRKQKGRRWRGGLCVEGSRCPQDPRAPGRWLQPSRPAPRNTNVRQIRLPGPAAVLAFIWIDIPAGLRLRERSAGSTNLPRSRHPPGLCCSPCPSVCPAASARCGRSRAVRLRHA